MLVLLQDDGSAQPDQWFVTNGVVAVGPLEFERVASGVAHGRFPASSYVRHLSWRVWRELSEIDRLSPRERLETVARFAGFSSDADARAADPRSSPPPPLEVDPGPYSLPPDSHRPIGSVRPAPVDPVRVLATARTLEEALLVALSTAVAASNADAGLLHRDHPELAAMVTTYAQGPRTETLLGARIPESDPSLSAARAGHTVLGEPFPGEVSRYVAGRFGPSLGAPRGIAMVPISAFGTLVAVIEVARTEPPFRAREVARIEDVAEALLARAVVEGWV